jgi:hypothetical protein
MLGSPEWFGFMADDHNNENGRNERKDGEVRVPPRTWLLWVLILVLIPTLVFFKNQTEARFRVLGHLEFLHLVEGNKVLEATIHYNPQSPLREITGKFKEEAADGKATVVPFRLETRLSDNVEEQL